MLSKADDFVENPKHKVSTCESDAKTTSWYDPTYQLQQHFEDPCAD